MLPENRAINDAWLGYIGKVMDPCQPREKFAWTRVDEIMEYARQRGMKKMEIQPLQRRRMQPDNPAKDFPAA